MSFLPCAGGQPPVVSTGVPALAVGCLLGALCTFAPSEARADAAGAFAATGLGIGGAVALVDLGFLVYDVYIIEDTHTDRGPMIAQTVLFSIQSAGFGALEVAGQLVKEDQQAAFTLGAMAPSIFANAMTTFSSWTLASEDLRTDYRFGVSWMIGANATLTMGAVASLFRPQHYANLYLSIPETIIGSVQGVASFVQAGRDADHRAEWIGLGAWSTVLLTHGVTSIVLAATDRPKPKADEEKKEPEKKTSWIVVPAPVTDGVNVAPGVVFTGVF